MDQWLTFDSRPPLDAWLNAYMGIIKSTCDKMVKELRDIDEPFPRTNAGEIIDGVSSMMATLDLQDRSNTSSSFYKQLFISNTSGNSGKFKQQG